MADAKEFRAFPKRWGAEFIREGEVRFRIWAPDTERLSLRLGGDDVAMGRDADGWFEAMAEGIAPGAAYGFVLPDGRFVPDPASRAQAGDVHGPSLVIDPTSYRWRNADWKGRPWPGAVIYELHVGAFTPEGTFRAAAQQLTHLAQLGVTAVELMPVGQFSGKRGWGYDGVLHYAPHSAYGTPEDLKHLVDEAHGHGLMVLLDVVYNHFGPDGNYLPLYASRFFDERRHTPWGAAIAYERRPVRDFFVDNALYWLEEFNLDGLRLDAIDYISDSSEPELLVELAERVRQEFPDRHVHLTTEDSRNVTHLHERRDGRVSRYTAEWNDDFHNAAHVLLTGEQDGYYADFAEAPLAQFARCLAEGFAYQGEVPPGGKGKPRGVSSRHLPTTAFVNFLQNHDQVGNRASGERLSVLTEPRRLEALTAVLLLSPHMPLLFMGEEWGETRPFLFFTDYTGQLATAVREGRRKEFAHFSGFGSDGAAEVPDPNAEETFAASKIDWNAPSREAGGGRLAYVGRLFSARRQHIVPLLDNVRPAEARVLHARAGLLAIDWQLKGGLLQLRMNIGDGQQAAPGVQGAVIHDPDGCSADAEATLNLPPWGVIVAVAK